VCRNEEKKRRGRKYTHHARESDRARAGFQVVALREDFQFQLFPFIRVHFRLLCRRAFGRPIGYRHGGHLNLRCARQHQEAGASRSPWAMRAGGMVWAGRSGARRHCALAARAGQVAPPDCGAAMGGRCGMAVKAGAPFAA